MKTKLALFLILIIAIGILFAAEFKGSNLSVGNIRLPTGLDVFSLLHASKLSRIELNFKFLPYADFKLGNSTLRISGVCETPVIMGETSVNLAGKRCSLVIYDPKGEIYIRGSNVELETKAKKVVINSVPFSSKSMISVSIAPIGFSVPVSSQSLNLKEFEGKLLTLTPTGKIISQTNFPPCSGLKMRNFIGQLSFENNTFILKGVASIDYRCE